MGRKKKILLEKYEDGPTTLGSASFDMQSDKTIFVGGKEIALTKQQKRDMDKIESLPISDRTTLESFSVFSDSLVALRKSLDLDQEEFENWIVKQEKSKIQEAYYCALYEMVSDITKDNGIILNIFECMLFYLDIYRTYLKRTHFVKSNRNRRY